MNKAFTLSVSALCLALAAAGLGGCVPAAVVGGAVGAGALLVHADRRSGQTQQADSAIEAAAHESVVRLLGGRGHVNITSYYRKVLIAGEVPTEQDRQQVEAQVRAVPDVQGVYNELAVMPDSTTWQRSNDALVTSRVRTRLMGQNGVPAGSIKVTTERGTTYLMGRLTASEAALATEVTRQTDGVQRVVRIIDLIADEYGSGAVTTGLGSPAQMPASTGLGSPVGTPVGAAAGTPVISGPAAASAAEGVVSSPVTQPVIVQPPQTIEVQTLPPVR
ncbi:MAG: BON domain-containing protein [Pseudomonadota bacterium]|nr:BON domain-containing protein [Pseudomonadota bacterium]